MNNPAAKPLPDPPAAADLAQARRWFDHARKAADSRNYDYAIELYVRGLDIWPEAVDDGLKPLRVAATARRMAGGKPPGFLAARKYPTGGKDPKRNLVNALHAFALDPASIGPLEAILVNAVKSDLPRVAHWVGPILADALISEKKLPESRYTGIVAALDQAAERFHAAEAFVPAGDLFKSAQLVGDVWRRHYPNSADAAKALSDASSKLTIVKGRFGHAEDFRGSLKNGEAQRELHDRDRAVTNDERARQLIQKARDEHQRDPADPARLATLVDMLARTELSDDEREAIAVLTAAYEKNGNYALKMKSDDLRMRQLRRAVRDALARVEAAPQDAAARETLRLAQQQRLEIETAIFRERCVQYPTDQRWRFELARRFFECGKFDDAIPVFQQAQADIRRRDEARLYVGRCFFEKKFYPQAADVLTAAQRDHEIPDDAVGKELFYWLGRTHEAAGQPAEAVRVYGQLIQFDYNYRDARQRLERLNVSNP
ncbi:MAG: hypothetical protein L6Q92_08075 [Phycisphaerae bacterium]|nr:hypothetical protein [Phycisphaerae bacterium]